jgi:hypothetical protein
MGGAVQVDITTGVNPPPEEAFQGGDPANPDGAEKNFGGLKRSFCADFKVLNNSVIPHDLLICEKDYASLRDVTPLARYLRR